MAPIDSAQAALEAVNRAVAELEAALRHLEQGDSETRRLAARWRDEHWVLHDVRRVAESIERLAGEEYARDRLQRLLAMHHGFAAEASEVGGELEAIIYEVRRLHPHTGVD